MGYRGRRDFRNGPGLLALVFGCTLLFAAAALVTYRQRGWTWISGGLTLGVLACLVGIVETVVTRVQLTDDALVVTDLRGRRRYPIADIERVEEARGAAPAVRLKDGRWIRLPVGANLGNSVRAWLKAERDA